MEHKPYCILPERGQPVVATPDPLREAARAFVDIWGETEAMESSHAFRALRAAIEEADRG